MIIGFLASGFIIKRFKLTPRQCVYMSIVCTFVSTLGFIGMFFFTCPVPPMAGVTIPYGYSPYMPNAPQLSAADFNLLSPCNTNYSCGTEKYSPVCGSDGVTYFSGCHAGCTVKQSFMNPMGFTLANYSNCACLAKLPPAVLAEKFGLGGKQPGGKPSSGGEMPTAAGGMEEENVQQRERRNETTPGIPDGQVPGIRESERQVPGNGTGIPDSGNQHSDNGTGMLGSGDHVPGTGAGIPDSGGQIPGNGTGVPGMRMPSFAIGAPCSQTCSQWKYFLASFVGVAFVGSFGMIPTIISVLRSLTPETKSFGMGVQVVFYRLIGFIPSPIYFGALIDSTCRLWSTTCGKRGSCLLYDLDRNRYYFLGLMVILRMCSILFELVAAHLFKKREESEPEDTKGGATNRDIAASLGSLAGSIRSLDTTGRVDNPKDTEELRMNIWNKGEEAEEAKPLA